MKNDLTSPIHALHRVRDLTSLPGCSFRRTLTNTLLFASLALPPAAFAVYSDGPVMEFLDFNRFDPPAWSQVSGIPVLPRLVFD